MKLPLFLVPLLIIDINGKQPTSTTAKPVPASGPGTTETISLSLTSKDSEATIKITKIIVEETKGGETDEYVIDMTERKVFLGNTHKSLNDLEVFDNTKEDKFEVEKMECGGEISKTCGFIELPANYQPGMDCAWTIPVKDKGEGEYKFDTFELGEGDHIEINGVQVLTKPTKSMTSNEPITVSFKSEVNSKQKSKMKISFEEAKEKAGGGKKESVPTDPNSKCKAFWFGEDGYPVNMNDDVGEGAFMFFKTKMVDGKTTSMYYNKETDITIEQEKSKVKKNGNYWKIGDQAWQMFTHKKDPRWDNTQKIDEKSCPTDFAGWTFKGNFLKDMKAKEMSSEEAEKQGTCLPKDYWKEEKAAAPAAAAQ